MLSDKLQRGESLSFEDRRQLIALATAELPWLGFTTRPAKLEAGQLQARWPQLNVVHYTMNGADDVIKYQKWGLASASERMITMRRPGCEEQASTRPPCCNVTSEDLFEISMMYAVAAYAGAPYGGLTQGA